MSGRVIQSHKTQIRPAMVTPTFIHSQDPQLINHHNQTVFHAFDPSIFWYIFAFTCPL